ncbi:MAG TPA: hypothetical protein ENL05_00390, partial [Candidatus Moranbacteria bacterium]|nr:hypothetical protein [Candidatus Moranbacteria bacterium]
MPKNFFKTFLVVVSIFLFSAGIIIPISVEALPIDGCCVNSTNPNNECIVPDTDIDKCQKMGDKYSFYTLEKCSNLKECGSASANVSAPEVGCCIDDADTYNKCVVSKVKNKIIKNKADCDSISDNGNFVFLSSNTLPEECANNPECSPET